MQSGPNLLPYLPVFILLVVGIGLSLAMVAVTRIMGPRFTSAIKRAPFESGSDPKGSARERFSVKFYMVDSSHNRILGWNTPVPTTDRAADFIIGQSTTNGTSPGSGTPNIPWARK